jgi:cell shape-determining protein MreD
MKNFLIFLILSAFASLFSATLISWNLPTFVILLASLVLPFNYTLSLCFIAGMIDDLVWTRSLGTSALLFLILVGIQELYSRKYDRFHLLFLFIFSASALLISSRLRTGQFQLLPNLLLASIIALSRQLWQALRESHQSFIRLNRG